MHTSMLSSRLTYPAAYLTLILTLMCAKSYSFSPSPQTCSTCSLLQFSRGNLFFQWPKVFPSSSLIFHMQIHHHMTNLHHLHCLCPVSVTSISHWDHCNSILALLSSDIFQPSIQIDPFKIKSDHVSQIISLIIFQKVLILI